MPSSADYRCRECGTVREFMFDGTPPVVHDARCCVPEPDYDCFEYSRFDRVWSAPHTGRGSSGEPPR